MTLPPLNHQDELEVTPHLGLRAYREENAHLDDAESEEELPHPAIYRTSRQVYRTLQCIVSGILLFALIYGWYWLSDPAEFPIKSVKIKAAYTHIDQKELQKQIIPYVGNGFIRMDTSGLAKQLGQLPWVQDVNVQRIWPDTLVIQVTEQQAAARWIDGQLLNAKGQLFRVADNTIPPDLTRLTGPSDQLPVLWQAYQKILPMLEPLHLQLKKLSTDDRFSLELELDNGMRILLGRTDPLIRLHRFLEMYPKIFSSKDKQADYADLRYANGLSIQWRENVEK